MKSESYETQIDSDIGGAQAAAVKPDYSLKLLLASMLFFASFLVLAPGFITSSPAPDESHWTSRSNTLIRRIRDKQFSNLTTHLPHPGIPGTLAMAIGQLAAKKFNAIGNYSEGDAWYLDELSGSRLGAIIMSSLFAPCMFLLGSMIFGTTISLFASVMFLCDPYFVAVGRQAHIDASLSLCMSVCALSFILSAITNKARYQIIAAIFWGLSISSKPTAILLLPALGLVRLYQYLRNPKENRLFYARDIWSLFAGSALFCLLYSRLWHSWGTQTFKLNPWKGAPVWSDKIAPILQANSFVFALALLAVFASVFLIEKSRLSSGHGYLPERRQQILRISLHLLLVVSLLGVSLLFHPELLHNLTGYLAWVFGLSNTPHYAYGRVWAPPPYGYLGLLFSKLPTLVLGLSIVAFANLVFCKKEIRHRSILISIFIACVVGGLSVSGKQAYRYLLPILPLIYLIAASSALILTTAISRIWLSSMLLVACLGTQLFNLYTWHDAQQLFSNIISGGLQSSMAKGTAQSFVGQNKIIDWLQNKAVAQNKTLRVGVIGDFQTLKTGYSRLHPKHLRKDSVAVAFRHWSFYDPGEYIVVYHSMLRRMGKEISDLELEPPVFQVKVKGVTVASIFQPAAPGVSRSVKYQISKLPRRTGHIEKIEGKEVLVATAEREKRDYLYYNSYIRVLPGEYRLELQFREYAQLEALDPKRLALRAELGSQCQKLITVAQLKLSKQHTLSCRFESEFYLQLRSYWFGYAPIALESLTISRTASPQ